MFLREGPQCSKDMFLNRGRITLNDSGRKIGGIHGIVCRNTDLDAISSLRLQKGVVDDAYSDHAFLSVNLASDAGPHWLNGSISMK